MRLPIFLLICVLAVAACNGVLAAKRVSQLRALPPLAETHPADAFARQLDAVTDPVALRRLALARHRSLLARDDAVQALLVTVKNLSRSDLLQSSAVFLLALGIYFSGRRSFRSSRSFVDAAPRARE